mmetsp:Transcript_1287/g.3683  ORF Transcript_1287/g.3683 Transcript_1287/m.3683 type:complete len:243 (-) Transcript_1287:2645-3373(-)
MLAATVAGSGMQRVSGALAVVREANQAAALTPLVQQLSCMRQSLVRGLPADRRGHVRVPCHLHPRLFLRGVRCQRGRRATARLTTSSSATGLDSLQMRTTPMKVSTRVKSPLFTRRGTVVQTWRKPPLNSPTLSGSVLPIWHPMRRAWLSSVCKGTTLLRHHACPQALARAAMARMRTRAIPTTPATRVTATTTWGQGLTHPAMTATTTARQGLARTTATTACSIRSTCPLATALRAHSLRP